MIVSQERAFLNARARLETICDFVEQAANSGERIDRVERGVFAQLLELGLTLLQAFVDGQGDGDAGASVASDGGIFRRLSGPRERRYLSIFGEVAIVRQVYGTREGQRIEHVPLDARLGLPEGEFSYVLMDWLQRLCVKESFHEAVNDLRALLNVAPSERAAEQMNQHMAQDAEIFQAHQSPPEPDTEGAILVATADGKGVPMRRPLEEKTHRSHPRRGKGEKANKKQMAYVGAVYSIDRFPRTAADVVDEVCRKQRAEHRPKPQNKQVWAEMTR